MITKYDMELMVKVAQMYYVENMKQEKIAKQLQISRSLISMILTEAREVGIVEINVRNPLSNNSELAKEIKSLFDLKDCIIVPTAVQDVGTLRKLVAQRAVSVFNKEVGENDIVGMAWGRVIHQFISYYKPEKALKDIKLVPLIGGSDQRASYFQINEMIRVLAEKIDGHPYFIHAPAVTQSVEEREFFMNSSSMQAILELWNNLDIILCGIGTLPNANKVDRETYTGEYDLYKQLEKKKAVGDIIARHMNINGEFISHEYSDRIIGVPLEMMKKTKKVISMTTGMEKTYTALGALNTKIIDIFISDEHTAKGILQLYYSLLGKN